MRNLDESRKNENLTTNDIAGAIAEQNRQEVVRFPRPEPAPSESRESFLPPDAVQEFRSRWSDIQNNFVDEPRRSVEEADKLVATAIQRIAEVFSERRTKLEDQWSRGDEVSTEDLRLSLQQYRSFFSRLLSI